LEKFQIVLVLGVVISGNNIRILAVVLL